ncbi:two component transcriptional regulator, winged helix family protein [Chondrocystis sp. NIES-4102]|nr:two component transcriptional regulator, winged helix family protein [Chondrocystis sp. NIES-4102]
MRILLIEDEQGIAQFITQGLKEASYIIDNAEDGQEGQKYLDTYEYDLIILDIMLPKISGLQLLANIRAANILTPVLLLTARDTVEDRVKGLDLGADDYLVKPFAFSELLARLRALQRRPPLQFDTSLQIGDLVMDTVKREVYRGGNLITLSPLEYSLLEYLMRNRDRVLTRTQIGEKVWNFDFFNNSNTVDVYIGYLRRKIDRDHSQPLIHTIRGVGYCLKTSS